MTETLLTVLGGCHCGDVAFEIRIPPRIRVQECNCSVCTKSGFLHVIVPATRFSLNQGEACLVEYRFHTGVARHLFCRRCGIKSFYVPRSNPDGYSVNLRCLELPDDLEYEIEQFDGRHWRANADALRHLSKGARQP